MPNFKAYAAVVVLPGLLMSGAAFGAPGDATTGTSPQQCLVTIDRSQPAGTFEVTRQVFEDGNCRCYVYTGEKPQSDATEKAIAELLSSKSCSSAPVQMVAKSISAVAAGASAGALGGGAVGIGVLAPLTAAAAAAAALAANGDGPASP